jgi:hypothetical protein
LLQGRGGFSDHLARAKRCRAAQLKRRPAKSHQLGRGIAKECRHNTAPTDIRHQASQSGGSSTFRGAADVPEVPAKSMLIPVFEFPVRSARNCVASGFKWYALT